MTAATFPNLSFENPPGTGPTLVSGNAEPYALADGDILTIDFAGIETDVVFLAADFADIAAATADEVAALLELRVDDLGAADDGGFVRLTSQLTGDDVTLQVVDGAANLALGFSTTAVTGVTYAGGPPDGWTVATEVDSVYEWAEFPDENGMPEETFSNEGWGTLTFVGGFSDAYFDLAFVPAPFETFTTWSSAGLLTAFVGEEAAFGTVGTREGFETEWGTPLYFAFQDGFLVQAADNPNDFETGWGNGSVGAVGSNTTFANGTKTAEDFEDVVDQWYMLTVVTAADGEWRTQVFGTTYVYTATGSASETTIATGIAAALDNDPRVTATALANVVFIWPTNGDQLSALVPTATSYPNGAEVDLVPAREHSTMLDNWVGQDQLQDF